MYEVFEVLLKRENASTADVSRATGIKESTFSNWKNRRNLISTKNGRLIAEYFGVSLDYLMTGNEIERESSSGTKYYFDDETAALAQELMEKPHLRTLLDAERNISPETANALVALINSQLKHEEGKNG